MIDLYNFRLDPQNYALAVAFFLNLILAAVIYTSSQKKREEISFAILALSVALWALGMFLYRGIQNDASAILSTKWYYVFAGIIPASFLYFSLNYPVKQTGLGRNIKFVLSVLAVLFIISPLYDSLIVQNVIVQTIGENKIFFGEALLPWGFYTISYFTFAFVFLFREYFSKDISHVIKDQYRFIITGSLVSVIIGVTTNHIFPLFFGNPSLAWIGPTATLVMTLSIATAIYKFGLFNTKLIITEVLIFFVWVALLVNLLLSRSAGTFVPNIFILVTVIVLGIFVIRSVIKEVEQREKLAIANAGQESLIHIMNHQIKGYLGKDRSIFAELITGDYGSIPDSAKPLLQEGLEQSARGVDYVQGILRGASAANGVLPYDMKDLDIKLIVTDIINHQKPIAEAKGLSFSSEIDDGDYILYGDPTQLGEALRNLVENAIRYNSINGSVFVTLHKDTKNVLFSVKDSGVGVADDVKSRLFTPGGRSKDSTKYNPESSGFGLAFVKGVIETHHGTVGYRPNVGEKGTTFFVQLPFSKEA